MAVAVRCRVVPTGEFKHITILREALFHDGVCGNREWIKWTVESLQRDLASTSILSLVPDGLWGTVSKIIRRNTNLERPCSIDVIDGRTVIFVSSCGDASLMTEDPHEVRRFQQALHDVLKLLSCQPQTTIDCLKNIARGVKSTRR
jgi:hypothetical protein